MAEQMIQEPGKRSDSEEMIERTEPSAGNSEPSSAPGQRPPSAPASGLEPELIFIPGGPFTMGSERVRDRYAFEDEAPQHQVQVAEFYVARYPVTNAEYRRFLDATGHRIPWHLGAAYKPLCEPDYPVVWVSWEDANAYCRWLSDVTGRPYRLPGEAEWEKAARGTDGRAYPWGYELPDKSRCTFASDMGATTTPVGRYSPAGDSPYGCADMAGNTWEWCHSLYKPYPYDAADGREDPQAEGPRVLRSGAFYTNLRRVRCASRLRYLPHLRLNVIGFRVAAD